LYQTGILHVVPLQRFSEFVNLVRIKDESGKGIVLMNIKKAARAVQENLD